MNSEWNSRASSVRTSSPLIQEPEDLAWSSIFSPGFGLFNSFFPPPLNLEAIIPFTTPIHSPSISPLNIGENPLPEPTPPSSPRSPNNMNLGTESSESSSGKKKMNMPKEFSGNRDNFKRWMMSCWMYIAGNHKVYPNDFDKINFVLSFMNSVTTSTNSVFTDLISNSRWTSFKFVRYQTIRMLWYNQSIVLSQANVLRVSRMSSCSNKD